MSSEVDLWTKVIIFVTLFTAALALLVFGASHKLPLLYRIGLALTVGISFLSFLFFIYWARAVSVMIGVTGGELEQKLASFRWRSLAALYISVASALSSLILLVRGIWILRTKQREEIKLPPGSG